MLSQLLKMAHSPYPKPSRNGWFRETVLDGMDQNHHVNASAYLGGVFVVLLLPAFFPRGPLGVVERLRVGHHSASRVSKGISARHQGQQSKDGPTMAFSK